MSNALDAGPRPEAGRLGRLGHCARRLAAALAVVLGAAAAPAGAANNHPVILVHGFAGFGPGEMLGYKYWGGLIDLEKQLSAKYANQRVHTATVGPFSSNWDRAVELYYQIKGGCVDYGSMHAAAHGHLRKPEDYYANGRTCYPGLYREWDAAHPVHLVSHSMGGQTSRMLVQLLAGNGAPANPGLFPAATASAWVKSVTTIATPNDGTTLAYAVDDWVPIAQQLIGGFANLANASGANRIYDFKMDQWFIGPQASHETFDEYVARVLAAPVWRSGIRDISAYDLAPEGAMRANDWVKDHAGVTYFSASTNASFTGLLTGWSYPRVDANPLIALFAGPGWMGNYYKDNRPFAPVPDSAWWPSDAVVNTVAQKAPTWAMTAAGMVYARPVTVRTLGSGGTPQAGAWNWLGLMAGFDHFDIIGWTLFWDSTAWYKAHVDRLRAL